MLAALDCACGLEGTHGVLADAPVRRQWSISIDEVQS